MTLDTHTSKEMIIASIDSQIESLIKSYDNQLNIVKDEKSSLIENYEKKLSELINEKSSLINSYVKQINDLKDKNISLIKSYEKQLTVLKDENYLLIKSYGKQINELKDENSKLKTDKFHSENSLKYQSDTLVQGGKVEVSKALKINNNTLNQLSNHDLKKFIISNLNQLNTHSSMEQCTDILANINATDPNFFNVDDQKVLVLFLEKVLKFEPKKELVNKFTYSSVLSIIKRFEFSNEFSRFVKKNGSLLNQRVLGINENNLIGELARIYFIYNNFECLSKLLVLHFDNGSLTTSKLNKRDFIHFLWYSFFLDKDIKIPRSSVTVSCYLNDSEPAILSYRTYYDLINGKVNFETGKKRIIDGLEKTNILGKSEKEKFLKSIDKRLKKFSKKNASNNVKFKENDDLRGHGYNITVLSKIERWGILESAVIRLGLKKVVYKIVEYIMLRKGQPNGEKKYSEQIREWEYDLYKLKKAYYNQQFTWPSTKLNSHNKS